MRLHLGALAVLFVLQVGCGAMGEAFPGDDDDYDGGDGDADADADADADSDADADAGAGENSAQDCVDDFDNDSDGLLDCTDLGCVGLVECCERATQSLLDETFDDTLNLGRWKPFGDGAAVVQDGSLYPSGDERHESGVVSNESFAVAGLLELQVTISVPSCEGACDELVGVALTSRNDYAEASTVDPAAGLVVDKSSGQAVVLLVVNGGVEQRAPVSDGVVSLTLQLQPDRRLRVTDDFGDLWFESQGSVDGRLTDAFVAVFGRSGTTAGVGEVKLRSGACMLPSSVHRPGATAILPGGIAPFALAAARSPSVARVPAAADLEMLFTGVTSGASSIGHATSADVGRSWITSPGETAILTGDEMPAGYGSPDDPALLIRASGERVAVVSAASIADASQRSLVFATSSDGLGWTVRPDPPLAPPEGCRSLRHPELLEPAAEEFVLFVTCEDADGLTSIRRADSEDLASWFFDGTPVLASDGFDPEEIDGVAAPTVLSSGGRWELWYEARSGVRRTLRYAVSSDGGSWERWEGTVLEPGTTGAWDDLQVGEPSVTIAPAGSELLLYYTGLGPAGQAIGLVTRALPSAGLPEL